MICNKLKTKAYAHCSGPRQNKESDVFHWELNKSPPKTVHLFAYKELRMQSNWDELSSSMEADDLPPPPPAPPPPRWAGLSHNDDSDNVSFLVLMAQPPSLPLLCTLLWSSVSL